MLVTERDKIAAKTLVEVLNKGSYKLEGVEVLVTARIMEWASQLTKRIEEDLKPKPISGTPVIPPLTEEKPAKASKRKKVVK